MSITRRKYNRFGERTDLKPTITFRDDYAVNLRTGEEIIAMRHLGDIENQINRVQTRMRLMGAKNEWINDVVGTMVDDRGPVGEGRYRCTCSNWGPRENSRDLCCQGCFNWAFDHHYEYRIHGQADWLTCDWAEGNTWGINVKKLRELNGK
jgi:hypothetical protein